MPFSRSSESPDVTFLSLLRELDIIRRKCAASPVSPSVQLIYKVNLRINALIFSIAASLKDRSKIYDIEDMLSCTSLLLYIFISIPISLSFRQKILKFVQLYFKHILARIVTCADLRFAKRMILKCNTNKSAILFYRYPFHSFNSLPSSYDGTNSQCSYVGDYAAARSLGSAVFAYRTYVRPSFFKSKKSDIDIRVFPNSKILPSRVTVCNVEDITKRFEKIIFFIFLCQELFALVGAMVLNFRPNVRYFLNILIRQGRRANDILSGFSTSNILMHCPMSEQVFAPSCIGLSSMSGECSKGIDMHCYSNNCNMPSAPSFSVSDQHVLSDLLPFIAPTSWSSILSGKSFSSSRLFKTNLTRSLSKMSSFAVATLIQSADREKQLDIFKENPSILNINNCLLGFESFSENPSSFFRGHGFQRYLVVYDVSPEYYSRQLKYTIAGDPTCYHSFSFDYFSDILTVAKNLSIGVLHKPKYDLSNYSKEYQSFLASVSSSCENYYCLDPYSRICETDSKYCIGSISLPFTSMPNFINGNSNLNFYYIPTGYPQFHDSCFVAHNDLVVGADKLASRLSCFE